MILYQFPLHRKRTYNSQEKLSNRNKKLPDNLRQFHYYKVEAIIYLQYVQIK